MYENIPNELKQLKQWICASKDKKPISPYTKHKCDFTQQEHWGTFNQVVNCGQPFIAFVFSEKDPYVAIDLDTYKNPALTKFHAGIVIEANTYTESSQSKKGSHLILKGQCANYHSKEYALEIRSNDCYVILTGDVYYCDVISENQPILNELVKGIERDRTPAKEFISEASSLSDSELWEKLVGAENGQKFLDLFNDNWRHYKEYNNDHSVADCALLTFLDFYSKDVNQVLRFFKNSKMYRSHKGRSNTDGTDYILRTLKKARSKNEFDRLDESEIKRLEQQAAKIKPVIKQEQPVNELNFDIPKEFETDNIPYPEGLVGDVATYIYQSSSKPLPGAALVAALTLIGGLASRAYNISGKGLNQYYMYLARPSFGKEGIQNGIDRVITAVRPSVPNITDFVGPTDFTNGVALKKELAENPCFFSIIGEVGYMIKSFNDKKVDHNKLSLMKELLNIYGKSGINNFLNKSSYSKKENDVAFIKSPNFTLCGESVPSVFYKSIDEESVSSGLLPRFCIVEHKGKSEYFNENSEWPPDDKLINQISELAAQCLLNQSKEICTEVKLNENAKIMSKKLMIYCTDMVNHDNIDAITELWGRVHLKVLKLAAVIALGVNLYNPVITESIFNWSVAFVLKDVKNIVEKFKEGMVGDQKENEKVQIILKFIRQYLAADKTQRIKYKVPKVIIDKQMVNYSFIRSQCGKYKCFKPENNNGKDTRIVLMNVLTDLVEQNILSVIPQQDAYRQYKLKTDLYLPGINF